MPLSLLTYFIPSRSSNYRVDPHYDSIIDPQRQVEGLRDESHVPQRQVEGLELNSMMIYRVFLKDK